MKNLLLITATFFLSLFVIQSVNAQAISAAGFLGWAIPGGAGVSDEPEDLNLDGGLTYGLDAMYHLDGKIGVGLAFNRSVLAGAGGGDIDLFGLRFIGAKAQYKFFERNFSPYAGLGLGLSTLSAPEISQTDSNGMVTVFPANSGSTFGILPEAGLYFGGFFVGIQYLLPLSYTIENSIVDGKALGTFGINLGYRYVLEL